MAEIFAPPHQTPRKRIVGRSLIFGENAVRRNAAPISSAQWSVKRAFADSSSNRIEHAQSAYTALELA